MTRSLHADVKTEIAKDSFTTCHLIEFTLDSTVYRLTDASHNLTYSSNTYTTSDHFLEFGAVNESSEVRVGSVSLILSSVEDTYLTELLSGGYIGKQFLAYRAFLDSAGAIIGTPVLIYDGRIDGYDVTDSRDSSEITLSVASHWSDFQKKAGRKTNINSQQLFFSTDTGFEFSANIVQDIKWGRI